MQKFRFRQFQKAEELASWVSSMLEDGWFLAGKVEAAHFPLVEQAPPISGIVPGNMNVQIVSIYTVSMMKGSPLDDLDC